MKGEMEDAVIKIKTRKAIDEDRIEVEMLKNL